MNFGEKLTNLRRQKGLSQEELGEKLNVTRQTISKWELGQTSPDSGKLTEISRFFGIGVNELTNEEDIQIDSSNPIQEEKTTGGFNIKNLLVILFVVIIIALIVVIGIEISKKIDEKRKEKEAKQMYNQLLTTGTDYIDKSVDIIEKAQDAYETQKDNDLKEQQALEEAEKQANQFANGEEVNTEEFIESIKQKQQELTEQNKSQQELLEEAQKMQQEMMQNASPAQQQMLQDAQARQQELLQKMQ